MSLKNPVIAVAGATGVVGSEMINILLERKFPFKEIKVLASSNSAGEVYAIGDDEVVVEELTESSFEGVDIALFATSAALSEKFVPCAVKSGAIAIDNSSHFRMDPKIPLVVPEVNPDAITSEDKIIANPNCSTIQLMPVLKHLNDASKIKRIVVSTYQAVSGAGRDAMDELMSQTLGVMNSTSFEPEVFSTQIAFNCIPHIDVFLENGYTKEEYKVINETRKILNLPDLKITCTAVRVPVFNAHAESVNVELENPLSTDEFISLLEGKPGISVATSYTEYPLQIDVSGKDDVYVGRIRADESVDNGINFWVVADNLRKGAALNAVQIAELFI